MGTVHVQTENEVAIIFFVEKKKIKDIVFIIYY